MNKSALILTNLLNHKTNHERERGTSHVNTFPSAILFLAIILVANLLPWVVLKSSSLTLGAYDLAEWATLHPVVRANNPTLLVSLLLRLTVPLTIIILAASLTSSYTQRILKAALIILLSISLMPPLEFFRQASGDPNLRQQFGIAIGTFFLASGISFVHNNNQRRTISILAAILAISCAFWGWSQSYQLIEGFQLTPEIGGGIIFFLLVYLVFLTLNIFINYTKK